MERSLYFMLRWFTCSLGIWIAVQLFGTIGQASDSKIIAAFLFAGLFFSAINAIVKPVITILALPFVLLTMGLFTLIINGLMLWITILVAPFLHMTFGAAILGSLVLTLINYVLNNFSPRGLNEEVL